MGEEIEAEEAGEVEGEAGREIEMEEEGVQRRILDMSSLR